MGLAGWLVMLRKAYALFSVLGDIPRDLVLASGTRPVQTPLTLNVGTKTTPQLLHRPRFYMSM